MNTLYHELKLVSDGAPHGSDVKVAEIVGYSLPYIKKLKRKENVLVDNAVNRKLLLKLIFEYRQLMDKEMRRITKIQKQLS